MADDKIIQELIDELRESKEREVTRLVAMESNISKLNKVLMGNGEIGLCERVRGLQKMLIPLWTLVSVIGLALLTGLVKLFLG